MKAHERLVFVHGFCAIDIHVANAAVLFVVGKISELAVIRNRTAEELRENLKSRIGQLKF